MNKNICRDIRCAWVLNYRYNRTATSRDNEISKVHVRECNHAHTQNVTNIVK